MNTSIQIAGEGSYQEHKTIINVGIEEKRAREIYDELFEKQKNEWIIEANETANQRINELGIRFMNQIQQVDKNLEMFRDPGFLFFLMDAQKSAASSERDSDIDVIADMLFRRFSNTTEQNSHVLLSRAIEVISQISDDSLLTITVLTSLFLGSGITTPENYPRNFFEDIDCYDRFFEQLLTNTVSQCTLPQPQRGLTLTWEESAWAWELELLDLLHFGRRDELPFTYDNLLFDRYSGVIAIGLKKESTEHTNAEKLLSNAHLNSIAMIEHEFDNNYVRLNINSLCDISMMDLTESQLECVQNIIQSYIEDDELLKINKNRFIDEWNKRVHLSIVTQLWNGFSSYYSFDIPPLGIMISMSFLQAKGLR